MPSYRGVKYCPNCGTGYALQASNTCGVCGHEIRTKEEQRKRIALSARRNYYAKKNEFLAKQADVALLQFDLPVLTEEEWQRAVNHFKCCAICGSEDIDGRLMFTSAKDGGKYNRGNVVPGCKDCLATPMALSWPARMRARLRDSGDKAWEKRFNDIIDYLTQEATRE